MRREIIRVESSSGRMDINIGVFDQLLSRLEPGYSSLEKRYKQLRLKLVKFFAWRQCEDPESLADETISRTVKNIIRGEEIRASNAYSYVYAIAVNVFREYLREKKKREELAVGFILPSAAPEDFSDCRMQCLEILSASKKKLLERYYIGEENRENLAQSLGLTINSLRLQIHRLKNDLKECYENCLKQLRET